jgi:hypothetical protein
VNEIHQTILRDRHDQQLTPYCRAIRRSLRIEVGGPGPGRHDLLAVNGHIKSDSGFVREVRLGFSRCRFDVKFPGGGQGA